MQPRLCSEEGLPSSEKGKQWMTHWRHPQTPHRWIILALVCALALAGNYLQYQITALGVVLMVRLHLDITSFSFLFLAPWWWPLFWEYP